MFFFAGRCGGGLLVRDGAICFDECFDGVVGRFLRLCGGGFFLASPRMAYGQTTKWPDFSAVVRGQCAVSVDLLVCLVDPAFHFTTRTGQHGCRNKCFDFLLARLSCVALSFRPDYRCDLGNAEMVSQSERTISLPAEP